MDLYFRILDLKFSWWDGDKIYYGHKLHVQGPEVKQATMLEF